MRTTFTLFKARHGSTWAISNFFCPTCCTKTDEGKEWKKWLEEGVENGENSMRDGVPEDDQIRLISQHAYHITQTNIKLFEGSGMRPTSTTELDSYRGIKKGGEEEKKGGSGAKTTKPKKAAAVEISSSDDESDSEDESTIVERTTARTRKQLQQESNEEADEEFNEQPIQQQQQTITRERGIENKKGVGRSAGKVNNQQPNNDQLDQKPTHTSTKQPQRSKLAEEEGLGTTDGKKKRGRPSKALFNNLPALNSAVSVYNRRILGMTIRR